MIIENVLRVEINDEKDKMKIFTTEGVINIRVTGEYHSEAWMIIKDNRVTMDDEW